MKSIIRFLKENFNKSDGDYGRNKIFPLMTRLSKRIGKGIFSLCLIKGMIVLTLIGGSLFSFAQHLGYDPINHPRFPYEYGDMGYHKVRMQGELFDLIYEKKNEEFLRVYNYFQQYGPDVALDINYISRDQFKSTYSTRAAALGNWEIIPYLIDKGIDIDWKDYNGVTTLIYASACGHLESVEKLVDAGADQTIVDNYGYTALRAANEGQEKFNCPEGEYDRVIALLTGENSGERQYSEEVHEESNIFTDGTLPEGHDREDASLHTAIAIWEVNPRIYATRINQKSSELAGMEAELECSIIAQEYDDRAHINSCDTIGGFSRGYCGAYALPMDGSVESYGVGMAFSETAATREALEMCNGGNGNKGCQIVFSHCQT